MGSASTGPFVESLESRVFLSAAEVIRNGGFEGTVATADWARTGAFQADSRFSSSRSGAGYAYLTNIDGSSGNNLSGTMSQTLNVPGTASSLTLSYWTRISTSETTTTAKNDLMTVTASDGTTVQTVGSWSNLDATSSYVQRTFSLNRTFVGKSITLNFSGSTNASLATTFRVDDVGLNAVSPATSKRIVGYLPDYRYTSAFSKLDLSSLTHVNYFSVSVTTAGVVNSPSSTFLSNLDTAVAAFHAAGITVSVTVGPANFTTVSSTQAGRDAFAVNLVNFALAHNLDGVDIDWEPPAGNSVTNYGLLIDDFYQETQPQHMLLTAAVNPWTNEIPVTPVNTHMDWLNVMCYDFDYANHSTYSQALSGMTDWTAYGVQKNKIVMGLPFYGRYGTSWSNTFSKTYSAILSNYLSINGKYPAPDLENYADTSGNVTYFNGVDLIRKKTQYVVDNSYGGMMIWEVGQDWFTAAGKYDQRSLLPVIKGTLFGASSIATVTPSPADNAKAPLNGTQTITVTVTGNASTAGALCLSLVGRDTTLSRDWVQIPAGAYSKTFMLSASDATAGTRGYEIYAQFRAGASSGPFAIVEPGDEIKLTPFHLNWQIFPSAPATPSPASGALLTAKPTLLDWADSTNVTSYDVYLDGLFKQNVTTSQWSTSGVNITSNVSHNWQVIAKNANGSTSGPTWTFSYDSTAPTLSNPSHNVDPHTISVAVSEAVNSSTGNAFVTIAGGSQTNIGSGVVSGSLVTYTLPISLADGNYVLRVPAGSISDLAGNGLAADYLCDFFILAADVNHNRTVDIEDFNLIAANYGKSNMTFSQGNIDYSSDGKISISDFNMLAADFGKTMSATEAPAQAAALLQTQSRTSSTSLVRKAASPPADDKLLDDVGLV